MREYFIIKVIKKFPQKISSNINVALTLAHVYTQIIYYCDNINTIGTFIKIWKPEILSVKMFIIPKISKSTIMFSCNES
jgi:ferritin